MPLHDWSTQNAEVFHDFHNRWTTYLTDFLNDGLLPGDLFARSEAGLKVTTPDDGLSAAGSKAYEPDIDVVRTPFDDEPGTAVAVAAAEPRAAVRREFTSGRPRQRSVAVRRHGGELVAAVEVVSHKNLGSTAERMRLADKCVALLDAGVHVVVLDVHPRRGGLPAVEELTAAAWPEDDATPVRGEGEALIAAYRAGEPTGAYYDPLSPGDRLPESPLFVCRERYVPLPLETTYAQTFDRLPRQVKATFG